jgi:hypothetical protein
MKWKLAIAVLALLCLVGCTPTETEIEHTTYIMSGRYYFNADIQGQVVTDDGNVWDYTQDIISEEPSYHNEPVYALLDDNGTPDNIYDDEILGLVLDRETAIYDALEVSLSESFTVERNGNVISISQVAVQ